MYVRNGEHKEIKRVNPRCVYISWNWIEIQNTFWLHHYKCCISNFVCTYIFSSLRQIYIFPYDFNIGNWTVTIWCYFILVKCHISEILRTKSQNMVVCWWFWYFPSEIRRNGCFSKASIIFIIQPNATTSIYYTWSQCKIGYTVESGWGKEFNEESSWQIYRYICSRRHSEECTKHINAFYLIK